MAETRSVFGNMGPKSAPTKEAFQVDIISDERSPQYPATPSQSHSENDLDGAVPAQSTSSMTPRYRNQPIPLVTFDDRAQEFKANSNALRMLANIHEPVYVTTVAGQGRTGKSFILNQLIKQLPGGETCEPFEVGHGVGAVTKGIWMWGEPFVYTTSRNERVRLIFLDTEGLYAMDKDKGEDYSAQMLMLAVLLSSLFVYNQKDAPNDLRCLDPLVLVAAVAGPLCKQKAEAPKFLWLFRDFHQLYEDPVTNEQLSDSDEMMERLLGPCDLEEVNGAAGKDRVAKMNESKQMIRAFFKDRRCLTLSQPAIGKSLRDLHRLSDDRLHEEFIEGRQVLVNYVKSCIQPVHTSDGTVLHGSALSALVREYVKEINSGVVPCVPSVWERMVQDTNRKALEAARQAYHSEFDTELPQPVEEAALVQEHDRCYQLACGVFEGLVMGSYSVVKPYKEMLEKEVAEWFERVKLIQAARNAEFRALQAVEREKQARLAAEQEREKEREARRQAEELAEKEKVARQEAVERELAACKATEETLERERGTLNTALEAANRTLAQSFILAEGERQARKMAEDVCVKEQQRCAVLEEQLRVEKEARSACEIELEREKKLRQQGQEALEAEARARATAESNLDKVNTMLTKVREQLERERLARISVVREAYDEEEEGGSVGLMGPGATLLKTMKPALKFAGIMTAAWLLAPLLSGKGSTKKPKKSSKGGQGSTGRDSGEEEAVDVLVG